MTKHYVIQLEIKDFNPTEGSPGHLSLTTMEVETVNDDISDIPSEHVITSKHSSLMPGGKVSMLANAVTVGTLPVPAAVLSDDHLADVTEAASVFRLEVTKEQYERAVQAQERQEAKVENGKILYGLFGDRQPLTAGAASLITMAAENYSRTSDRREQSSAGVVEREDTFGMPLPPHNFSDVNCSGRVTTKNCVDFALGILNKVGINVAAPLAPSDVAQLLREQGFTEVDHNLAMSTASRSAEAPAEAPAEVPAEAPAKAPAEAGKSNFFSRMFSFFSSPPSTGRTLSADSSDEAETSYSNSAGSDSSPTASSSDTPTASSSDTPTASSSDTPTASSSDTPTASSSDMPTASSSDTPTASSSDTPTVPSSDAEIASSSQASDDSAAFTAFNLF